ncbi:hypothetical protein TUM17577_40400 [Enterobacter asburiae]|nr:hypothetical protein TUM17577_40400 [Enterobacter asburiae]
MRTVKLRQLYAAARQLEQANILIQHLPHRSHILTAGLLDQPHGFTLPFADLQRWLANKIERLGRAMGYFSGREP